MKTRKKKLKFPKFYRTKKEKLKISSFEEEFETQKSLGFHRMSLFTLFTNTLKYNFGIIFHFLTKFIKNTLFNFIFFCIFLQPINDFFLNFSFIFFCALSTIFFIFLIQDFILYFNVCFS